MVQKLGRLKLTPETAPRAPQVVTSQARSVAAGMKLGSLFRWRLGEGGGGGRRGEGAAGLGGGGGEGGEIGAEQQTRHYEMLFGQYV